MTQEDAFRAAEGGLIFGFALPLEKGNLRRFKVVRVEAERHDDRAKILTKIIGGFRQEPARFLMDRPKQLGKLFESQVERGRHVVVIVTSAHVLTSTTIYDLKIIGENSSGLSRPNTSGFVLLGNPSELEALIKSEPGIWARSITLPFQLRQVPW